MTSTNQALNLDKTHTSPSEFPHRKQAAS